MKQKGFTLIEMIGVVTLLAVILLVALPNVTSLLRNNKDKDYENYLKDLYIATENYVVVENDLFPELNYDNGTVSITIGSLIDKGYVASDKKNPKTEQAINPDSTITVVRNIDRTYSFEYHE